MSQYATEFQNILREYNGMFDVFYCKDEEFAKQYFNTKMMPKELPHVYIIDPKGKKEIKKRDGTLSKEEFYMPKYQGFIFNIATPGKELTDLIDKFLDEKLEHHFVSEDRQQKSHVKWLNSETFESEIVNNPNVTQCVVEIIKDHCPACFISKFNTNMITRKMHKHGLIDQLPFYRMKITNQVPWLGDFPHTPMHLFVKKEGNSIVEIKLLDSPLP